ncbi:MAG: hypothetical protein ACI80V_003650 [Rhodothermales bacterium]|jgi:hypothetical protein
MPPEIMAIAIIAIVAGTILRLTQMSLAHREGRSGVSGGKTSSNSSSVTTSELERMLQKAVKKATDPLIERMDELEDRVGTQAALPEAATLIEFDEVFEDRERAMAPKKQRTR